MKKEYGKFLRSYFSKEIPALADNFKPTRKGDLYPGEVAFTSRRGNTSLWIIYHPCPTSQRDYCSILVGWSASEELPDRSDKAYLLMPTHEFNTEPVLREKFFLISTIHLENPRQSANTDIPFERPYHMGVTDQLAAERCKPIADRLLESLKDYGLPYLAEYLERRNSQP